MNNLKNSSKQVQMAEIEDHIQTEFPQLNIHRFSSHEIRVDNPERRGLGITLRFPHSDTNLEGFAFAAETKQVIIQFKDGFVEIEEQSRWIDKPKKEKMPFDIWLNKWLKLMSD